MKNILFILLLLVSTETIGQSRLRQVKQKLNNDSEYNSQNNSSYHHDKKTFKLSGWFVNLLAKTIYHGGKAILIGNKEIRAHNPIPYYTNKDDCLGEYTNILDDDSLDIKKSFLQASLSYSHGKNNINNIKLNTEFRFNDLHGITFNFNYFFQKNLHYNDELMLSNLTYNFYRIREHNITLWWNIGLSHLGSGINQSGFVYGIGLKLFLKQPISFLISWQQNLFEFENINETKFEINYHKKRFNYFVGYNHYNLASIKTPSFTGGIRYKFL